MFWRFGRLNMGRTKQTARKSVGGPVPIPSVTPSLTTAVKERDGQTASGGKRTRDGTMRWTGKCVVFPVGGKRGEPIEM